MVLPLGPCRESTALFFSDGQTGGSERPHRMPGVRDATIHEAAISTNRRRRIPFKSDDWVVHPQHGIGRVVKLETRQFGQTSAQPYYEIALTKGTIWVPVDGPANGLRKLTSKADMGRYRGVLKSRPKPLATDHRRRQLELTDRLKESSFGARCEIVRDLTAHSWAKPLGESSAGLLRLAHEVLDQEWAAAQGLSLTEAAHEVQALLLEGRQKYEK